MTVEYNGTLGSENYLTAESNGNPANVTTISGGSIAINSINLVTASPTNAGTVQFTATFATAVTGLSVSNFALAITGGISGANITSVSGSGSTYTITVNTGTGNGTIGLNLANANGLGPGIITSLPFAGSIYIIDHTVHTAPVIITFSPASGLIGTPVTITGSGFDAAAANNIVFFGATRATVTAASATSLTVIAPAGATYQSISVLNSSLALVGYSGQPFVTTFTPAKGAITTADFMPPVKFTTGPGPGLLAVGDLDGDGKPDVVIVNGNNTISVLRNISVSGSITPASFAPKVDFAVGNGPGGVAIGDIDGDGKYDIVVTNGLANSFSVLRNTSTVGTITSGSFAAKVDFATDSSPNEIKVSDMDGDGKADIVVRITYETDPVTFPGIISIFRNTSTEGSITANSFAAPVDLNYGTRGNSSGEMAIGDLDGDGKPDIAVATFESEAVAVFRNTTTPGSINNVNSFAAPTYFPTAFLPVSVAIGDLDGDGKPELAVSCYEAESISVLKNTSVSGIINAGSFAAHIDYPAVYGITQMKIGDLDGDGKPDLAVAAAEGGVISLYRNTLTIGSINSTSFAPKVDLNVNSYVGGVTIADLDGDGRADLITAQSKSAAGSGVGNTITVLQNAPFFPSTVQATNVTFSNTVTNSTTASWTNGNGTARAVFISHVSSGGPLPVNRTTYAANTIYGSGTQVGTSGWYCIYNGTGNTVNITGLSSGASYRVMVAEYNGIPGSENYLTTPSTGNPANVTTITGGPVAIDSINRVTSTPTNVGAVQFTATFLAPVTGVTINNFVLATTGTISGAAITSVNGSGAIYTVTVNTGTGDGTIGLNLGNATGLMPGIITPLAFAGQTYTIDRTGPLITISNPSDSTILSGTGKKVVYTVTYTDPNFNTSTLSAPNIILNPAGSAPEP